MKAYLVGGAVRDKLLGLTVQDRDYVVVGATPDEMIAHGYKLVGADFPVFLHPQTKYEYALARTERKTGPGYKGFSVYAAPEVTLEQDLARRDLTINAMAEDEDGRLIDPFGGAADLKRGLLRHVSPAFVEDPLRVLRVARFAARFGFRVADETLELMRALVRAGEMQTLVAERVWAELSRALGENQPWVFFETLRACGAQAALFPELDALFGVPQPPEHHPEIDTGVHTLLVLQQAARLSNDLRVRFAALVHDLGKGTTPPTQWPRHIGHEERGVELIQRFCQRFRVPADYREFAEAVSRYHLHCHRALELRPETILKTLEGINAFRKPERTQMFVLACEADARGRTGLETRAYPQAQLLLRAYNAAKDIGITSVDPGTVGVAIGKQIRAHRVEAIAAAKHAFATTH